MKTSFAEFMECPTLGYRGPIYIDCDQVLAVAPAYDRDGHQSETRTILFTGADRVIRVEGSVKDILDRVKAFSKGGRV